MKQLASGGEYMTTDTFNRTPCRIGLNIVSVQMRCGVTQSILPGVTKRSICHMMSIDSPVSTFKAGLILYPRKIVQKDTLFLKIKSVHTPAKKDGVYVPLISLN